MPEPVEFAVWAPIPQRVRLQVDGAVHEMRRDDGGWWRAEAAADGWGRTRLQLPIGAWRDLLTGARVVSDADGARLAQLLDRLPVALLTRDV